MPAAVRTRLVGQRQQSAPRRQRPVVTAPRQERVQEALAPPKGARQTQVATLAAAPLTNWISVKTVLRLLVV